MVCRLRAGVPTRSAGCRAGWCTPMSSGTQGRCGGRTLGCSLGASGCSQPDPAPPTVGSFRGCREHVSCFGSDRAL